MWPFKRKQDVFNNCNSTVCEHRDIGVLYDPSWVCRECYPVKGERVIEITCGHNEHYHWIDDGWPCPTCTAIEKARLDKIEEERFLNSLADKIVERLKKEENLETP